MSRKLNGGTVASIWRAGKRRCWLCGHGVAEADASRDHVRPRSQGGYDKARNYELAHRLCNGARGELPADRARAVTALHRGAKAEVVREALRAELARFRAQVRATR